MLKENAEAFCARHPEATVIIFSSWAVFSQVSTSSSLGGLRMGDASYESLFVDGFHPSSVFHSVIAQDIEEFLDSVPVL